MKITVEEIKETKQVWPQSPFLAYDVQAPNIVMLVINDQITFLRGFGDAIEYPYVGTESFSARIVDCPHALFTGKIVLENE